MRRLLILLVTGVVLAPLTACGSDPPSGPPAGSSAAAPSPGSPPAGLPSAGSPPGSPPTEAAPSPSAAYPEPSSGEVPGGLPFGERSLTGVIERSGDCTMLRVGNRLWGLTGTPVPGLRDGEQVAVVGQVTTPDPACAGTEVTRALVVHRATPI